MDIDVLSIILLESFGIVSFLLALVFFKQSQKISDKQQRSEKATTDEIWDGPCYSYKWVMSRTLKPRKLLEATPFLVVCAWLMFWFVYFYLVPWIVYSVPVGPALVALIGVAILFSTNSFEAYSYSKAVQKAPLDHLRVEDQSYMELAKEALDKAVIRFLIISVVFVIVGPFIPQIFDGLIYALVTYAQIVFLIIEASNGFFLLPAIVIASILTGILLYLPVWMGRIIFRRVKVQSQRIWERWRRR